MVPEVPTTMSKPAERARSAWAAALSLTWAASRRSSRAESGSLVTKRSVMRSTPSFSDAAQAMRSPAPRASSTLPPPMSMTRARRPSRWTLCSAAR